MKVIVSGSCGGIGLAAVKKFLATGNDVVGIDIAPSVISDPHYMHVQMDIRDENLPAIKDVEIIVSAAGIQDESLAVDVNLLGNIAFVKKYLDSKKLKSVLFIASSSARNGAEFPLYSASKGGIVTYMKNLASTLAKRGVTVNSLSPGGVNTTLNEHIIKSKKLYQAVLDETLLKKWAEPEEIAEWIYFLTVVNKSMTGEDILVDNGEMLKSNFIW